MMPNIVSGRYERFSDFYPEYLRQHDHPRARARWTVCIAARLGADPADLGGIVDELEAAGLIASDARARLH